MICTECKRLSIYLDDRIIHLKCLTTSQDFLIAVVNNKNFDIFKDKKVIRIFDKENNETVINYYFQNIVCQHFIERIKNGG